MINVIDKNCIYEGCKSRPHFNNEGEKTGLYCFAHKLEGMTDVGHKKCIHEGCSTRPNFNNEGEKTGLYCSAHKLEGMINVIDKNCIHEGCSTTPVFNNEGEKTGLYCCAHKLEGMINVIDKKCIHEGCSTRPNFNNEGEKIGLYCLAHKLEGMINVMNKNCIHEGCSTKPLFNNEGEKIALYCRAHKFEGMIDVCHVLCKSISGCYTRAIKKYDNHCLPCYIQLFPGKPVCRNYKTKEFAVVEFVKTEFPDYPWIADRMIYDGCSKKRPDLVLDLGSQVIMIEVDENQHKTYDCSCENKRLMELSQDVGHRPIVFIRFNPDAYFERGHKISSCWELNKLGIRTIKKSKKKEWETRLSNLKLQITYWLDEDNSTDKTVETIQLFYDR